MPTPHAECICRGEGGVCACVCACVCVSACVHACVSLRAPCAREAHGPLAIHVERTARRVEGMRTSIRDFSLSISGLWSSVSDTALPARHRTARESPTCATESLLSSTRQTCSRFGFGLGLGLGLGLGWRAYSLRPDHPAHMTMQDVGTRSRGHHAVSMWSCREGHTGAAARRPQRARTRDPTRVATTPPHRVGKQCFR